MGKRALVVLTILMIAVLSLAGCSLMSKDVTITFEPNGGTEVTAITAKPGTILDAPDVPTKDGYGFDGWYTDDALENMYIFGVMGKADTTLYAKWVTEYGVVLHANGGTGTALTSYPVGGSVTLPIDYVKENFIFDGWYANPDFAGDRVLEIPAGSRGTKHFYAKWRSPQEFPVNLIDNVADGEVPLDPIIGGFMDRYKEGVGVDLPEVTRSGYVFLGWYDNAEFTGDRYYKVSAMSIGELTFYARWQANPFTLTYVAENIEGELPPVVYNTDTVLDLPKPTSTIEGMFFDGWYVMNEDETLVRFEGTRMPPHDLTLYAKWSEAFTVSYDLGDGNIINENHTPNEVVNKADLLDGNTYNTAMRTFEGWYLDTEFATPVGDTLTIDKTMTLYAKWSIVRVVATGDFTPYLDKFSKMAKKRVDSDVDRIYDSTNIDSREELVALMDYMTFMADKDKEYHIKLTYMDDTMPAAKFNEEYAAAVRSKTGSNSYDDMLMVGSSGSTYTNKIILALPKTFIAEGYTAVEGQVTNIPNIKSILGSYHQSNRSVDFDAFKYKLYPKVVGMPEVRYSDQLFYTLQYGIYPEIVTGSKAESIMNEAKNILRSICDDTMTDTEKMYAIYTWIADNCNYDYVAAYPKDPKLSQEELTALIIKSDQYTAYHADGIFDSRIAVCDGISKAVTIMANIEGIPCVRVTSINHAWNKVYLDIDGSGVYKWYAYDITWGNSGIGSDIKNKKPADKETMVIDQLLFTDADKEADGQVALNFTDLIADTEVDMFDFYPNITKGTTYDVVIDSDAEFNKIILDAHDFLNKEGQTDKELSINFITSDKYMGKLTGGKLGVAILDANNKVAGDKDFIVSKSKISILDEFISGEVEYLVMLAS